MTLIHCDGLPDAPEAYLAETGFFDIAHPVVRRFTDAAVGDAADARTRHAHPPAPNWYLGTVGTHPDHRRRGLAAAVVEPVLTRCDADGTVAFLETSSDDNVRGYRRLGFEVVFETVTSDGVLPLYVMHRTPVTRAR